MAFLRLSCCTWPFSSDLSFSLSCLHPYLHPCLALCLSPSPATSLSLPLSFSSPFFPRFSTCLSSPVSRSLFLSPCFSFCLSVSPCCFVLSLARRAMALKGTGTVSLADHLPEELPAPSLSHLPKELFVVVASHLKLPEICQLRATCRTIARYSALLTGACVAGRCKLVQHGTCVPEAVLAWAVGGESRSHQGVTTAYILSFSASSFDCFLI